MSEQPPCVLVERSGAVARITLNRPGRMNAIGEEMRAALPQAIRDCEADPAVRVMVICGAGEKAFCVGADIKELRDGETGVEARERLLRVNNGDAIAAARKPVIAAVHGHCLGGGLEIALACDLRFASEDAYFALPEVGLGLIPGAGGTQRLPALIGVTRAMDMILTTERMPAREALGAGLVSRLFADKATLLETTMRIAEALAERAPLAVRFAKEAVRHQLQVLAGGLTVERDLYGLLMTTEDRREGAAAFQEKRRPSFRGC